LQQLLEKLCIAKLPPEDQKQWIKQHAAEFAIFFPKQQRTLLNEYARGPPTAKEKKGKGKKETSSEPDSQHPGCTPSHAHDVSALASPCSPSVAPVMLIGLQTSATILPSPLPSSPMVAPNDYLATAAHVPQEPHAPPPSSQDDDDDDPFGVSDEALAEYFSRSPAPTSTSGASKNSWTLSKHLMFPSRFRLCFNNISLELLLLLPHL
jgi:hypothetical protein